MCRLANLGRKKEITLPPKNKQQQSVVNALERSVLAAGGGWASHTPSIRTDVEACETCEECSLGNFALAHADVSHFA